MKKSLLAGIIFSAAAAFGQTPDISGVSMSQESTSRRVIIHYTLSGAPGVITVQICTNHVSIGDANTTFLTGDVNKLVTDLDSERTIYWQADKSWPDHRITNSIVSARVTAWATNTPPDYMVVDMQCTNTHYYTSVEALPDGGLSNNVYKSSRIVLRRIAAGGVPWTMGQSDVSNNQPHPVTLADDYYIGIYEMTQGQVQMVIGSSSSWLSKFTNALYRIGRPQDGISYDYARGTSASYYPASPAAASFLGILRSRTGVDFDLPSEAQWEYACRAGHEGSVVWNDGSPVLSNKHDTNLDHLGRYYWNNGYIQNADGTYTCPDENCTPSNGTAIVGSYWPNSLGLYDMHGNLYEWCLDWYHTNITENITGAVETVKIENARVVRGGCWTSWADASRSGNRLKLPPNYATLAYSSLAFYGIGFRVMAPAVATR